MSSSHEAPPEQLRHPLEVNPEDWAPSHLYTLVTSLVVPRPVGWISTMSLAGQLNLAPYSYFNLVADRPPHVMFSSIGVKDTLRNVRETAEFVVNLAGRSRAVRARRLGLQPPGRYVGVRAGRGHRG